MLIQNYSGFFPEAGSDEAGRGCLAGPVTAATVIIPKNLNAAQKQVLNTIADSKTLSEKKRFELKPLIEDLFEFAVSSIDHLEIDKINILNASLKAMQLSILQIQKNVKHIIIDGNRPLLSNLNQLEKHKFNFSEEKIKQLLKIPSTPIIKGDAKFLSIAAASILAKTHRDEIMEHLHQEFPMYNWKKNKGYPTKDHREAIKKHGSCQYHRQTFRLLPVQLSLHL